MVVNKRVLFVLILSLSCLAMGSQGEKQVVKAPAPDRSFAVTLADQSGRSFLAEKFSQEGLTYLPAMLGKAEVSIDFQKIRQMNFFLQDKKVLATVTFVDAEIQELFVEPGLRFFGRSKWGDFTITARDIKQISFQ